MKYLFKEPLVEGIIKSRPNRFIMEVLIDGEVLRCHCPSTGRIGNIKFEDIPCLLSKAASGRKTPYTVEAFSLDPIDKEDKSWIGINQSKSNRYIKHFLSNNELSMFSHVDKVKPEVKVGKSRLDFKVNDKDYVEVKTMLAMIDCSGHPKAKGGVKHSLSVDRLLKHYAQLGELTVDGSRAIVITCFTYDADMFQPPEHDGERVTEIRERIEDATNHGVEQWQVNLGIDKYGVSLLKCFKIK
ncbi:sugar fermentation stimulation protein [Bacillus phage SP-15]|uniref:Sugar fermentation stimulation protein n=1 Tax=Bacillus phage SP-15 TaxID=1792032 RepID=A0A127AYZ0_9CAUD|nr:sugar fermentation stimulation protein [Bacillus phage SP-15]AMM44991.1 sugar fermentation stimulation protein [Bacillus phage SP-15]